MSGKLKILITLILSLTLLLPLPAAAQSGAVKPAQNKVPIRTVADVPTEDERSIPKDGQTTPPAANRGNSLSPTAKIIIVAAVITAVTVITIATRKKRVCGPLSGCPLF